MASKRELEQHLEPLEPFTDPAVELEQYATPATLAATLLHLADLQDDLDRPVVDLGAGTGVLALGAALRGADPVFAIECDLSAIEVGLANEASLELSHPVHWLQGDATRLPIRLPTATVLMNPPFGAQYGHEHADRAFLEAVSEFATVSYSIHNAGSWEFVEAFSVDNGGLITHAYEAPLALDRQYEFHETDRTEITVELFRIDWS